MDVLILLVNSNVKKALDFDYVDMTIDEIKDKYNITDEITPELEEELKKEFNTLFTATNEN
jgi:hypothetical protein